MLSKKLAIAAASAALMLGAFAPMAFADVNVSNGGGVVVSSETSATSGGNSVTAAEDSSVSDVNVTSGDAVASNTVGSLVNQNTVSVSGDGNSEAAEVNVHNCGFVGVEVSTDAVSGGNTVATNSEDGNVEDVTVANGNATAASNVQSLVNVNNVTVNTTGSEF